MGDDELKEWIANEVNRLNAEFRPGVIAYAEKEGGDNPVRVCAIANTMIEVACEYLVSVEGGHSGTIQLLEKKIADLKRMRREDQS